jgi:excisionase family DNA binding protein
MQDLRPDESLVLNADEAALLLGISRSLVYDLCARRELPYLRLGRRILIPRHALLALLDLPPTPSNPPSPSTPPPSSTPPTLSTPPRSPVTITKDHTDLPRPQSGRSGSHNGAGSTESA